MDDACIFLQAKDSKSLEAKLCHSLSIILNTCRSFGMTPNCSPGKTEVVPFPAGPGAKAFRARFFGPVSSRQLTILGERQTDTVHVVGSYRHLGGLVQYSGKLTQEIRQRLSIAHSAFAQHRRSLFQNMGLTWKQRIRTFQSLVLSKLCCGAESWIFGDKRCRAAFHASVMRLYRRLLRLGPTDHVSDAAVLHQCGLPAPELLLRRARLRYFGRLFQCGHNIDWGLLRLDVEWIHLLREDFDWMWQQLSASSPLKSPGEHMAQWEEIMSFSPQYWKRLTNRACLHACKQDSRMHLVEEAHRRVWDLWKQAEYTVPEVPLQVRPDNAAFFACLKCRRVFRSRGGQGARMCKVHGQIDPCRHLFDTTACPACLKEFFTFAKLQVHLQHAHVCRRQLHGRRHWVTPVPGIGSTTNQSLEYAHAGLCPAQQGLGPQVQDGPEMEIDRVNLVLLTSIQEILLSASALRDAVIQTQRVCSKTAISWTDLLLTFHRFVSEYSEDDASATGFPLPEVLASFQELCSPSAWKDYIDHNEAEVDVDFYTLDELRADCLARLWSSSCSSPCSPRFWQAQIHFTCLCRAASLR